MNKLKQVDRNIIIGLSLTVIFLIIWLISLPHSNNVRSIDTKNNDLSTVNETLKKEQFRSDVDYFNKAHLKGNISFCEYILNKTMKKECKDTTPDQVVIIDQIEEMPKVSPDDLDYYNKVLLYKDKIYCQYIIDEKLKEECNNITIDAQIQ